MATELEFDRARELAKKLIRGGGLYLQAAAPAAKTGLTVTITPSTSTVINQITGESQVINNVDVEGEFYSVFIAPGFSVELFSVTFTADVGYYLESTNVTIRNEDLQNGYFELKENINSTDDSGRPTEIAMTLVFYSNKQTQPTLRPAIVEFEGVVAQPTVATTSKIIHKMLFPKECSNIRQNLDLGIVGELGSQFKVTCTASGITNIIPDIVHTIAYNNEANPDDLVNRTLYNVRVPIPAKSTDTVWTVTVVPESGTTNGTHASALTLTQRGLKTLTFVDDVTGINNITFPDNVITLSHGNNINRRFYEVDTYDLNNIRKDYQDVSITITASSGSCTIRSSKNDARPKLESSFTNINNNGILIKNIQTTQTSSTVVTLTFKVKVPRLTANVSSAIKLNDFLING